MQNRDFLIYLVAKDLVYRAVYFQVNLATRNDDLFTQTQEFIDTIDGISDKDKKELKESFSKTQMKTAWKPLLQAYMKGKLNAKDFIKDTRIRTNVSEGIQRYLEHNKKLPIELFVSATESATPPTEHGDNLNGANDEVAAPVESREIVVASTTEREDLAGIIVDMQERFTELLGMEERLTERWMETEGRLRSRLLVAETTSTPNWIEIQKVLDAKLFRGKDGSWNPAIKGVLSLEFDENTNGKVVTFTDVSTGNVIFNGTLSPGVKPTYADIRTEEGTEVGVIQVLIKENDHEEPFLVGLRVPPENVVSFIIDLVG